jgi:hypothetical protein
MRRIIGNVQPPSQCPVCAYPRSLDVGRNHLRRHWPFFIVSQEPRKALASPRTGRQLPAYALTSSRLSFLPARLDASADHGKLAAIAPQGLPVELEQAFPADLLLRPLHLRSLPVSLPKEGHATAVLRGSLGQQAAARYLQAAHIERFKFLVYDLFSCSCSIYSNL